MLSPGASNRNNRNALQSLDAAMLQDEQENSNNKDSQSVIESYKRRSNTYFANPQQPPKELFVPIPSQVKPMPHRTPFYRN